MPRWLISTARLGVVSVSLVVLGYAVLRDEAGLADVGFRGSIQAALIGAWATAVTGLLATLMIIRQINSQREETILLLTQAERENVSKELREINRITPLAEELILNVQKNVNNPSEMERGLVEILGTSDPRKITHSYIEGRLGVEDSGHLTSFQGWVFKIASANYGMRRNDKIAKNPDVKDGDSHFSADDGIMKINSGVNGLILFCKYRKRLISELERKRDALNERVAQTLGVAE